MTVIYNHKWCEVAKTFVMADCVREMTAMKICKSADHESVKPFALFAKDE